MVCSQMSDQNKTKQGMMRYNNNERFFMSGFEMLHKFLYFCYSEPRNSLQQQKHKLFFHSSGLDII